MMRRFLVACVAALILPQATAAMEFRTVADPFGAS
jgi:hypothetical protein